MAELDNQTTGLGTHRRDVPARDWARSIVKAWLLGHDVEEAIDRVPEWQRDLAASMARGNCENIRVWCRKVRNGWPLYRVPKSFRPGVEQLIRKNRSQ